MTQLVVKERKEGGICVVTLNDPSTRNAMSDAMAAEFKGVVADLNRDPSLRVIILTGSGGGFSGGGHLDMLFEKTKVEPEQNRAKMMEFYHAFLSIRSIDVPIIAAINGHAVGAGLCLALGCDIRVASSQAKLGANFVLLGLHPGMGATYSLPRLVGYSKAAELLFTGSIISADEALRIGMVSRVVEPEQVMPEALKIAQSIASAGPAVTRQLRRSLLDNAQADLETCLQREAECQALNYSSAEFLEGITAAREKRKPNF